MKNKKIEGNIVDIVEKSIFNGCLELERGKIASIKKLNGSGGRFILPGWIDAHVHVESSMITPGQFARACVPHGTIAVVADPHEIANVLGTRGVEYMIENGKEVPVKFYFGAPSCVPATPFETSGAGIRAYEVDQLLQKNEINFLAEMMNFPGVLADEPEVMEKIASGRKYGKPVDGHAPGLTGENLKKYIEAGISTDHESYTIEEAREKISMGMKILIRNGSAAKNFDELIPLMNENPEMLMFCSDDLHPDDLVKGHINLLVKRALEKGYGLFDVLRAASLNPARHYGLDTGMLQPGDPADFIVVDDLERLNVIEAYINGKCIYSEGETLFSAGNVSAVNKFDAENIGLNDLMVPAIRWEVYAIQATDGELITGKVKVRPAIENDRLVSDPDNDIIKLTVINRYVHTRPSVGFIRGLGIKEGAFGCSIAHDSHNVIVAGVRDTDILEVANAIINAKGGIAVYSQGEINLLELPVAGLMSLNDAPMVAKNYHELNLRITRMGSSLQAPIMTLSFMSLLVIPELKLGDRGLFDVNKFDFIPLYAGVE